MDRKSFIDLYADTERPLRAYLVGATGSLNDSRDLMQCVWKILWEKFGDYDASRPFHHWAMGIARFEVFNWRRRLAKQHVPLSEETIALLAESAVEDHTTINRRHEALLLCLDELDDGRKRLVRLRYYDGVPIAGIAEQTRRTIAAVEMALVRVRRALGACIEQKLSVAGN